MAGILAASTAPWVVTKAGVLMPVREIAKPEEFTWDGCHESKEGFRKIAKSFCNHVMVGGVAYDLVEGQNGMWSAPRLQPIKTGETFYLISSPMKAT